MLTFIVFRVPALDRDQNSPAAGGGAGGSSLPQNFWTLKKQHLMSQKYI